MLAFLLRPENHYRSEKVTATHISVLPSNSSGIAGLKGRVVKKKINMQQESRNGQFISILNNICFGDEKLTPYHIRSNRIGWWADWRTLKTNI